MTTRCALTTPPTNSGAPVAAAISSATLTDAVGRVKARRGLGCSDGGQRDGGSEPREPAGGRRGRSAVRGRRRARRSACEPARRQRGLLPHRGLQRPGAHPARPRRERAATRAQGARPPSGCRWREARTAGRWGRSRSSSSAGRTATRVFAPVTNRGEAIGVLELRARRGAGRAGAGRRRARRARPRLRRHRQPPVHRPLRVGPALGSALARRGDPASPAAGRVHLRGGAVHPRRLAGARRQRRRRHLRLRAGARHAAPLDDRRHGPRGGRRAARHAARRRLCGTRAGPASVLPSRLARPTTGSPRTPPTGAS